MKSYRSYSDGQYLRQTDFPNPVVTFVTDVQEKLISSPGKPAKPKLVLFFDFSPKGLVMNMSNCDVLFALTNADDPESWIGTEVEIFADPDVTYAGKRVGGVGSASQINPLNFSVNPKTSRTKISHTHERVCFKSNNGFDVRQAGFTPTWFTNSYGFVRRTDPQPKQKKEKRLGYLGKKELIAEVRKYFPNCRVLPNEDNNKQAS